jgi:hypothetical protein
VGKDVWEIFVCRIPEIHDVDLYDMSGVGLAGSSEWITSQLEPVGDYFERWSNGRYMVEFRAGGEIEVSVGAAEECVDAALERSARDVHGVLVVADAQHRENRVGGWGRKGHECEYPCSASESKRAIYLGAADFVSGPPVVLDLVEHEFGHALDWPHSFRTDPYDSVIDVMSDSAAPRRNGGSSIHAPGVLAINRYLSGWMDHGPLVLDSATSEEFEIDEMTFAVAQSSSTRVVSIEVIGDDMDNEHLDSVGIAVHLIDWSAGVCDDPQEATGSGDLFCLGATRSQRLIAPEESGDGMMRVGDRIVVDGITIHVESVTRREGSIVASMIWN